MTATYTFDVFSTLDGFASYGGGDWGGYWGKQGSEFLEHRLARLHGLVHELQRLDDRLLQCHGAAILQRCLECSFAEGCAHARQMALILDPFRWPHRRVQRRSEDPDRAK
jgi:hypothetical protein